MRRWRLPLLLLCLLLQASLWTPSAPAATGARKLTSGGALVSLHAWTGDYQILGKAESNNQTWLEIDPQSGAIEATSAPVSAQRTETERLVVEVEGTIHRLKLDGKVIYETSSEILGRPALAPDGTWLVVTRYPRGNETADYGNLWRYDLKAERWLQLTASGVEEYSPVISPDGYQVAVLREGDAWLLPADRTSHQRLGDPEPEMRLMAIEGHEPPETIRVKHDPERNHCREIPEGHDPDEDYIVELPFEEYLKRVVPHESPRGWHPEALKAQAVAARTYAWRYVLNPADPEGKYDVTDSTRHQYMCDETYDSTNAAVEATRGQHLTYKGALIPALFSAENASPTKQNTWGHHYLSAVEDPPGFGRLRNGHGQGYSQWGGKRWADHGWSYIQILRHFYTGAQIEPAAGSALTLLDFANRPATYSPGASYLRGSALYLEANANHIEETRARDWVRVGDYWTVGAWQSGRKGSTSWKHLFDLRHLPDLPYDSYRVELNSTPETPASERPVLRIGIDRTRPALNVFPKWDRSVPNGEATFVKVNFQAFDGLSGLHRIGWGHGAWQREAEEFTGEQSIFDPTASQGRALRLESGGERTVTFPSIEVPPLTYRVWFRLRTDRIATDNRVATLRLFDNHEERPLQRGVRYLRAAHFATTEWQWFYVDVDNTANYTANAGSDPGYSATHIIPKIEWHGYQRLDVDRVIATVHPSKLYEETRIWATLPDQLIFFASDYAGNVSFVACTVPGQATTADVSTASTTDSTFSYQLYVPLTVTRPGCVPFD